MSPFRPQTKRQMQTATSRGLFAFFGAAFVWLASCPPSSAVGRFDNLTGVDQSFTLGSEYRSYSEFNRDTAVYDLTVPDEEKEQSAVREKDEEKRRYDAWSYSRSAGYNITYDSNINNARQDPKDDLIHNEQLSLGMTRKARTNFVELFYDTSYSHQTENEKATAFTHTQSTRMGYTLGRLTLELSNVYSPSKTFETGERTELIVAERSRATATSDVATISARYAVSPKTSVRFGYDHALFYLPSSSNSAALNSGFSTINHSLHAGVSRRLTPKLTGSAEYSWGYRDFYRGGIFDTYTDNVSLRLDGRVTPKTRVSAALGFFNRRYLDRPVDPREGTTWSASISQKLTPKVVVTLNAVRTVSENLSSDSFLQDGHTYGVDFSWKFRPKLSVDFGGDMGFYSTGDLITQPDADNPAISFTRLDENEQFSYYAKLQWTPKPYLSALLGYEFLKQNANFKDNEFDDHKMVGSVQARF